jgi:hypothetical protein
MFQLQLMEQLLTANAVCLQVFYVQMFAGLPVINPYKQMA